MKQDIIFEKITKQETFERKLTISDILNKYSIKILKKYLVTNNFI